jgi:hypothetical protein
MCENSICGDILVGTEGVQGAEAQYLRFPSMTGTTCGNSLRFWYAPEIISIFIIGVYRVPVEERAFQARVAVFRRQGLSALVNAEITPNCENALNRKHPSLF